jgi:hypothetical protein
MKRLFFALVLAAFLCSVVNAQIGVTYTDKVVWRGFELNDESNALSPQINLDISGITIDARGLLIEETEYEDMDDWDSQVSITKEVKPFKVTAGFGYYDYPDGGFEFQELWSTIGLPIGLVTPRYTLVRAENEGQASDAGWLHVVGIDLKVAKNAGLFAEAVFNDGFSPFGKELESDWTHVTSGASIDFPIDKRIILTPAVFYQRTLEEAVNPQQEQVWYAVSLMYAF